MHIHRTLAQEIDNLVQSNLRKEALLEMELLATLHKKNGEYKKALLVYQRYECFATPIKAG